MASTFKQVLTSAASGVVNGTASDVSLLNYVTRLESLSVDAYEKKQCAALYRRIKNKDITRNDVLRTLSHILEYHSI